jgi:flagellar basal body-associated protein FliL
LKAEARCPSDIAVAVVILWRENAEATSGMTGAESKTNCLDYTVSPAYDLRVCVSTSGDSGASLGGFVSIDDNAEVEQLRRTLVRLVLKELADGDPVPIELQGAGLEKLKADIDARLSPLNTNQESLTKSFADLRDSIRELASSAAVEALKSQVATLQESNGRIELRLQQLAEAGNRPPPGPPPPGPPPPGPPPPGPPPPGPPPPSPPPPPYGRRLRSIIGFGSAEGSEGKAGSVRLIVTIVVALMLVAAVYFVLSRWLGSDTPKPGPNFVPTVVSPAPNESEPGDMLEPGDDLLKAEDEKDDAGNKAEAATLKAPLPTPAESAQPPAPRARARRDRGQ